MNWYYVDAGQQAGPVDDAQLAELVRTGKIQPSTMVWREGLANWQPFQEINPASPPTAGGAPAATAIGTGGGEGVCAECGRIFNLQDMIAYGDMRVCASCKPVFMQKLAEGAALNTGALNYAGFWVRFGAKLLDGLILGALFIPFFAFVGIKNAGTRPAEFQLFVSLLQLGYLAVNLGYGIFFLGKYGATPGKMACKLKVVTAEGLPIGYARATGRVFAELLSGIVCYIGYIIAGFDDQKRALHDHICNTRVVYK